MDNKSLYIIPMGDNTVIGKFLRESTIVGELTLTNCLVINQDSVRFYEIMNINCPECVEEFDKCTRDKVFELIADLNCEGNVEHINRFIKYYDGIQYFGEFSSKVKSKFKLL